MTRFSLQVLARPLERPAFQVAPLVFFVIAVIVGLSFADEWGASSAEDQAFLVTALAVTSAGCAIIQHTRGERLERATGGKGAVLFARGGVLRPTGESESLGQGWLRFDEDRVEVWIRANDASPYFVASREGISLEPVETSILSQPIARLHAGDLTFDFAVVRAGWADVIGVTATHIRLLGS